MARDLPALPIMLPFCDPSRAVQSSRTAGRPCACIDSAVRHMVARRPDVTSGSECFTESGRARSWSCPPLSGPGGHQPDGAHTESVRRRFNDQCAHPVSLGETLGPRHTGTLDCLSCPAGRPLCGPGRKAGRMTRIPEHPTQGLLVGWEWHGLEVSTDYVPRALSLPSLQAFDAGRSSPVPEAF